MAVALPLMQKRTWRISKDNPWAIYAHEVKKCKHPKRKIFRGCKTTRFVEHIDFTSQADRDLMIELNMVLVDRSRVR